MEQGFIKLHREVRQHWTHDKMRPEWFMAWTNILMATDHKTSTVNLTEVFQSLQPLFNNDAWRYFVKRLVVDGMIEIVSTSNGGFRSGKVQVARVINYAKYHGFSEQKSTRSITRSKKKTNTELARSKNQTEQGVTSHQHGANTEQGENLHGALHGVYKESIYSLSELTTSTPPTECKEEKGEKSFQAFDMPESLKSLEGFDTAWQEWLTNRKQAKKPVTPLAAKKQLKFLRTQPDPVACIDHAIMHGWQGLWPLKQQVSKHDPGAKKFDISQTDWTAVAEQYAPDGSTWDEWNALRARMSHEKN